MDRQLYLAAYDISDEKRLQRMTKAVHAHAVSAQKSAVECWLSPQEKRALLYQVKQIMRPEQDRFALIRLKPSASVIQLGKAMPVVHPLFFYQG